MYACVRFASRLGSAAAGSGCGAAGAVCKAPGHHLPMLIYVRILYDILVLSSVDSLLPLHSRVLFKLPYNFDFLLCYFDCL